MIKFVLWTPRRKALKKRRWLVWTGVVGGIRYVRVCGFLLKLWLPHPALGGNGDGLAALGRHALTIVGMDADRFARALKRLRMNDGGAARFFGIDPRTVRRYKAGELPVPVPIAMLLTLLARNRQLRRNPNLLRLQAGFDPVTLNTPPGRPWRDDDDD